MRARGYLIEVELTDDSLIAEGTNKVGQVALRGERHGEGPLVIPRDQITDVRLKKANPAINGNLVIQTRDGGRYQLHFRRKSQAEFAEIAAVLTSRDASLRRSQ